MASSLSAPVWSGLVQPLGPFGRFTRVHIHSVLTLLAAHSAAPVELALALGDAGDARGVVAAPAAHHLAAVCPAGHLAAHPARRAQGACGGNQSLSGCSSPSCSNTSLPTHLQGFLLRLGISVCTGDLGCGCFRGEISLFCHSTCCTGVSKGTTSTPALAVLYGHEMPQAQPGMQLWCLSCPS